MRGERDSKRRHENTSGGERGGDVERNKDCSVQPTRDHGAGWRVDRKTPRVEAWAPIKNGPGFPRGGVGDHAHRELDGPSIRSPRNAIHEGGMSMRREPIALSNLDPSTPLRKEGRHGLQGARAS